MKYIFIRNDDVRGTIDDELVQIVQLNIKHRIPISLTVEPANVTAEVVAWLLKVQNENPELIEIVQHGYDHKLKFSKMVGGKLKKGEFGGDRSYEDQYRDIKKGKDIMDDFFADKWFPLFTFPFGARNIDTLRAIRDSGFLAVNGSYGTSWKYKLLYFIGRFLKKEVLFNRKISYNLQYRKGLNLFQVDTSISVISKYLDGGTRALFYSLDELKSMTLRFLDDSDSVGIVLHHRYHVERESIDLLEKYFRWLATLPDVKLVTQEKIYNHYMTR